MKTPRPEDAAADPTPADASPAAPRTLDPGMKFAVEFGPLIVFFVGYFAAKRIVDDEKQGLIWATGVFIVVSLIALAVSYAVERRVQPMTVVTTVVVTIFGGLTIYLNDDTFIKRKPTIVSGLMGGVLLGGLAVGRSLIQPLMSSAFQLDDAGWRKLTLRWGLFFLFIAGLNEVAWRRMGNDAWMTFKLFGITGLTFVFLLTQLPMIQRHSLEEETTQDD